MNIAFLIYACSCRIVREDSSQAGSSCRDKEQKVPVRVKSGRCCRTLVVLISPPLVEADLSIVVDIDLVEKLVQLCITDGQSSSFES